MIPTGAGLPPGPGALEHVTVGSAEPAHGAITYFTNHAQKMDDATR